jgi:RNA polymerase sigma-70 factor (ECF subfamily)
VDGSCLPWLLVIATNEVRNQQRSLRRWAAARGSHLETSGDDLAEEVAQRVDDVRRMRAVLDLLRRLPHAEQEVLVLCGWSGLSYSDAAAVLGLAEASVRSRVSRARARLAGMSEQEHS